MQSRARSQAHDARRVAFVVGANVAGGGERFLIDLCEHLVLTSDFDVLVIGDVPGGFHEKVVRRRPWFASTKWSRKHRLRTLVPSPLYFLSVLWLVVGEHRSHHITAFHLQYKREQLLLTWPLSMVAPVIWTEHGRLPPGRLLRAAYRISALRAECIVGVSEPVAESVRDVVRRPRHIAVIRNGVDSEFFRPPTYAERTAARTQLGITGETVAVVSSRLEPAKNLAWVPELCAAEGVELLVMGDGTDRGRLELVSAEAGATSHFIGRVEGREQIRTGYWSADFSCHGQDKGEGLPLSLLEATACGCVPVALSEHDLVSAFVLEAGGIVDPAENFVETIMSSELRRSARAWAEGHNIRLVAQEYAELFCDGMGRWDFRTVDQ